MLLASRDEEILCTLARRVRLFSLSQVAAQWWSATESGAATARKRLAKMLDAGLLERQRITARPLPVIEAPAQCWRRGDELPDFGALAWRLQARWSEPPRPTTVYLATARAANLYGGRNRGRLKRPHQASHDLGAAAVYLRLLQSDPQAAKRWVGEDVLDAKPFRGKVPDAALVEESEIRLVIEFGGAYDKTRLVGFHHACARLGLPYEVW